MKKLEFENLKVGSTFRRKGTKDGYLNVIRVEDGVVVVKFIETRYTKVEGINGKEYKITFEDFYKFGYIAP